MLTNGKFWAGIVTGVVAVYGYNYYRASRAAKG